MCEASVAGGGPITMDDFKAEETTLDRTGI